MGKRPPTRDPESEQHTGQCNEEYTPYSITKTLNSCEERHRLLLVPRLKILFRTALHSTEKSKTTANGHIMKSTINPSRSPHRVTHTEILKHNTNSVENTGEKLVTKVQLLVVSPKTKNKTQNTKIQLSSAVVAWIPAPEAGGRPDGYPEIDFIVCFSSAVAIADKDILFRSC